MAGRDVIENRYAENGDDQVDEDEKSIDKSKNKNNIDNDKSSKSVLLVSSKPADQEDSVNFIYNRKRR